MSAINARPTANQAYFCRLTKSTIKRSFKRDREYRYIIWSNDCIKEIHNIFIIVLNILIGINIKKMKLEHFLSEAPLEQDIIIFQKTLSKTTVLWIISKLAIN